MRHIRRRLLFLLILLFLFCSCTADKEGISSLCEHLKNPGEEKYNARITAIFPKREVSFSVEYLFSPESDDRVTVTAPEEIAGIAFSVSEEDAVLEFDGARLTMGSLDEDGLSPLSLLPALIRVWRGGNYSEALDESHSGEDAYLMIYNGSPEGRDIEYRTWFSKKDFAPLYAEIYSSGIRVMECKFERTR